MNVLELNHLDLPVWLPPLLVGTVGLVVGSFLNVVIHRLPVGESVATPASRCPICLHRVRIIDNIPVVSWLLLRGRCRDCGGPISPRYPIVEVLNLAAYLLAFNEFGLTAFLPVSLVLCSALIVLAFIDAEHMILPNRITYPLFVLFVLYRIIDSLFVTNSLAPAINGSVGALIGGGLLFLLGAVWKILRGIDAMGFGDVKMMAVVGMLLGWQLALLSIFIGALLGSTIGLVFAIRKGIDLQTPIPFGVFLAAGSFVSLLFGTDIIDWYLRLFI
jgi:leader peptidase (prepilin peptidase)/N-methyltransferase